MCALPKLCKPESDVIESLSCRYSEGTKQEDPNHTVNSRPGVQSETLSQNTEDWVLDPPPCPAMDDKHYV